MMIQQSQPHGTTAQATCLGSKHPWLRTSHEEAARASRKELLHDHA